MTARTPKHSDSVDRLTVTFVYVSLIHRRLEGLWVLGVNASEAGAKAHCESHCVDGRLEWKGAEAAYPGDDSQRYMITPWILDD
jgi:hypothetical protein